MIYRRGDLLTEAQQKQVLAQYVHRFTGTHCPDWAKKPMPNGGKYHPHFKDDADWLRRTYFPMTKSGGLSCKLGGGCHSNTSNPDVNAVTAANPCNEAEIDLPW